MSPVVVHLISMHAVMSAAHVWKALKIILSALELHILFENKTLLEMQAFIHPARGGPYVRKYYK